MVNDFQAKLDEVIDKFGYKVSVLRTDDNIFVNYAAQKEVVYNLAIGDNLSSIEYSVEDIEETEIIWLPNYLIRLYILLSIYQQCRLGGFAYEIIRYEGTPDLLTMLPMELSADEQDYELALNECASQILNDRAPMNSFDKKLEKVGLYNSFVLIKGLLL